MKNLHKIVLTALTAIVLVSCVAVLTPRAVHAVVATLVRDVDNPGRHPFSYYCGISSSSSQTSCTIPVPVNEEWVIQNLGCQASSDPVNKTLITEIYTTVGLANDAYHASTATDTGFGETAQAQYNTGLSLTLYADPSTNILVQFTTKAPNPIDGLIGKCFLTGYSVSLP